MMKIRTALAVWTGILLAVCAAHGEGIPRVRAPETPAPVRTARPQPEPTPDIPDVINRVSTPDADGEFRFPLDAKILHIWFPNIMNADEAILLYDGEAWLIDCGDKTMGKRGAELIRRLGITKIGRLFNSHPHHDHLDGLKVTDEAAGVGELLVCFGTESTDSMARAVSYAEKQGIPVSLYGDGSVFAMGDGAVTLRFYAGTDPSLDMNNQSAMAMVRYGERTILFMADVEQPGQASLLARTDAAELKADLLKYPHHGKSAMNDRFLDAVSPAAAVVTNRKKAEEWDGIRYLADRGIPYIYTNTPGFYLHLMTDGEHWIVEHVPQDQAEAGD